MIQTLHESARAVTQVVNVNRIGPKRGKGRGNTETMLERIALRDRQTYAFADVYGGGPDAILNHRKLRRDAALTPEQLWSVYLMCGDVRSAVDSIARRVSTRDWRVEPKIPKDDPRFPVAEAQCERATERLQSPNEEDDWRTLAVKIVVDTLVFWHGAIELVYAGNGTSVVELAVPYGPRIHPEVNNKGRWIGYIQDISGATGTFFGAADARNAVQRLRADQIALLRLNPSSRSPYPVPIIETIIREITTLVRFSERTMHTADRHQVPTGFLVLTGIARGSEDEIVDGLFSKAGRDHEIHVVHSMGATAPAQWIRTQETYKEVEYRDVTHDTRNVVWRNFGVNRVEMGETEGTNRASSDAQIEHGDSSLIEPLLEAVASMINRKILGPVARGKASEEVLCRFLFSDDEDLTPEEEKLRAEAAEVRLRNGVSSINEERLERGQDPVDGGEVNRVISGGLWVPIGEATEDPEDEDEPEEDPDPEAEPDEEPEPEEESRGRQCVAGCDHPGVRALLDPLRVLAGDGVAVRVRADELPEEWGDGRFAGHRTVDLEALFGEMTGYNRDVDPVWDRAVEEVQAAVDASFANGAINESALRQAVDLVLLRMQRRWSDAVLPRYLAAADLAAEAADLFAGPGYAKDAPARALAYHDEAMGHLDALRADIAAALASKVAAARSHRADLADVRDVVEAVFASARHRITNWSGRLTELASLVLAAALALATEVAAEEPPGEEPPVEWLAWWVSLRTETTCEDCFSESSMGARPVAALTRYPGGQVQCRANCRCVLVYVTRAELNAGAQSP